MTRGLAEIDWEDVADHAPAVVTAIAMPPTVSIANGIAFGFILCAATKLLAGRIEDASPAVTVLRLRFLLRFVAL